MAKKTVATANSASASHIWSNKTTNSLNKSALRIRRMMRYAKLFWKSLSAENDSRSKWNKVVQHGKVNLWTMGLWALFAQRMMNTKSVIYT